MALALKDVK